MNIGGRHQPREMNRWIVDWAAQSATGDRATAILNDLVGFCGMAARVLTIHRLAGLCSCRRRRMMRRAHAFRGV